MDFDLFPREEIAGVFRGFREGGLEFHADLSLPYRSEFQSTPMHGQFLLVQLESPDEAVLGRITSLSSEGKLSSGSGEDFSIRAVREDRPVPEGLREDYLKYRVNIRVLGVLRRNGNALTFVASHRRLPHVGSPVAFLAPDILREVSGHNVKGALVGHLAMGEYIYNPNPKAAESWMQLQDEEVGIRFALDSLVSRRTFIFARAGFGKSNLNKLLFSQLYQETPTIEKRQGRQVPVGTVLFDPEGEYFWPDDKGRPGLCDVEALEDKLVVFTSRGNPSPFYESFVAGGIKLDVRRLRPSDVIGIALSPERQDQQNVRKLRGLNPSRWERLVDLIHEHGNNAPLEDVSELLQLQSGQDVEALAARANATAIVRMLHDPSSRLMDVLMAALKDGKLCVIDLSQMQGGQALILSGLILRRIFDRNQREFTAAVPETIPTIAVVEEAQVVLNESATAAEPYIAWVKEGRKYDLGAVLVTQQPGSIPNEILSQGDNWFIFHLLSGGDLGNVRRANAHFSEDLLSTLLNEPIPGQGVFWSSVEGKPYPVPVRVLSFEDTYCVRDPEYKLAAGNTYAAGVGRRFREGAPGKGQGGAEAGAGGEGAGGTRPTEAMSPAEEEVPPVDFLREVEESAIEEFSQSDRLEQIRGEGCAWGSVKAYFRKLLPEELDDADEIAYRLVAKALDRHLGPQKTAWHTFKHPTTGATWVKAGAAP